MSPGVLRAIMEKETHPWQEPARGKEPGLELPRARVGQAVPGGLRGHGCQGTCEPRGLHQRQARADPAPERPGQREAEGDRGGAISWDRS